LYLQINNQIQQNQFPTISGMTRGSDSAIFSLGNFLPLMKKKKSNATHIKGLLPKKEHQSRQSLSFSFNRHI
jgi:hypothetical protein